MGIEIQMVAFRFDYTHRRLSLVAYQYPDYVNQDQKTGRLELPHAGPAGKN
jgi:hypothetical protein